MSIARWAVAIAAVLLVAIQAVRPAKTNPPLDEGRTIQARTQMPQEVAAILARACDDCHSHKTTWPWYGEIAPFSWYLVHDVNEGRRKLSLSDWASYNPRRADRKLRETCEQVGKGEMPPALYLLLHPSAKIAKRDEDVLCAWTQAERGRLAAAQAQR